MPFLEGFNQAFFPVLLQHLDEQRKRKQQEERFGQLQTDTNETVWKPQGETVYGQPEGALGVRYPTQLPVPQQVSQQIPLDDPRILQALMNFRAGGGEQQDVNNFLNFRQMGLPQYKTTEGAQGQLLEQEQERLTGRTKNVRELTPPIFNRNMSSGNLNIRDEDVFEGGKTYKYRHFYDESGNEVKPKVNLGEVKPPSAGQPPITFLSTAEGYLPANRRTGEIGQPSGVGKPLTNEMITAEQQISGLQESLNKVKETYKPEYVGAVAGRFGSLKESTVGVPEDQATFYADLADIGNTLIYLKSGKQINETEYQRLLKQLPDRNNPEPVFRARMVEFQRILDNILSTRQSKMGGYGSSRSDSTQSRFKILEVK